MAMHAPYKLRHEYEILPGRRGDQRLPGPPFKELSEILSTFHAPLPEHN